jgi:hypothetical protein
MAGRSDVVCEKKARRQKQSASVDASDMDLDKRTDVFAYYTETIAEWAGFSHVWTIMLLIMDSTGGSAYEKNMFKARSIGVGIGIRDAGDVQPCSIRRKHRGTYSKQTGG